MNRNQKDDDDDDDESNLLAALASSVHNMDQYEEDVLKTAELESTPKVTGIGFPPLHSMAPSGRAISDMSHLQTILTKVRTQLLSNHQNTHHQQPHNPNSNSNPNSNVTLLLKQQMLLNLLHTVSNDQELCVRPQEELRQEQERRKRFRRSTSTNNNNNNNRKGGPEPKPASAKRRTTESSSFSSSPKSHVKRTNKKRPNPATTAKEEGNDNDGDNDGTARTPQTGGDRLEQIKQGRSVRFSQDSSSTSTATATTTATAAAATTKTTTVKRARVGIQQRKLSKTQTTIRSSNDKRNDTNEQTEDDKDHQQRKEHLKRLRLEREARRQRRKQQWNTDTSAPTTTTTTVEEMMMSEEEQGFQVDVDNPVNTAADKDSSNDTSNGKAQKDSERKPPSLPPPPPVAVAAVGEGEGVAVVDPSVTVVQCPLCQASISAPNQEAVDETLSQHMKGCQASQTTRGQRRSARVLTSRVSSYAEEEEEEEEHDDDVLGTTAPQASSARQASTVVKKENDDDDGDDDKEIVPDAFWGDDVDDDVVEADTMEDTTILDKPTKKPSRAPRLAPASTSTSTSKPSSSSLDDWDEDEYEDRVDDWIENGIRTMRVMKERDVNEAPPGEQVYEGGLVIPAWVNDRLFPYQRTGLQWMWELHRQQAGGIIGDEMGLGKTVQMSAFLGCLAACRKSKSILVIAPATILQHWLKELAVWAPGLRRILIHPSGEIGDGQRRVISTSLLRNLDQWLKQSRRQRLFEAIDEDDLESRDPSSFCGTGYVLVTTYENVRRSPDIWTNHNWGYIVMDEAQKIRNPDADITLVCKVSFFETAQFHDM
jgi:hypothetical protein